MAFLNKTQRVFPAFKSFLPKAPIQHFHTGAPKWNPLRTAPVALLSLQQRSPVQKARSYSTTPDSSKSPFFWTMVGQTTAYAVMAAYLMVAKSNQTPDQPAEVKPEPNLFEKTKTTKMEGQVLIAHKICLEIQKSYDNLSLNQIKENLSRDYFPDEESFAKHVIGFEKSAIKAEIPLDDSFLAYASKRKEILTIAKDPESSKKERFFLSGPRIPHLNESASEKKLSEGIRHVTFLSYLPPEIAELKNLESLDLSYSNLSTLPDSLAQLKSLRKLSMHCSELTEFPPVIKQLTGLTHLDLGYNWLTSIPDEIGNLMKLEALNLDHNKLQSLPESIGQLTSLGVLELGLNALNKLPDEFGSLSKLKSLDLSINQLSGLPETVKNLTQLETVNLSANKFIEIPKSVQGLPNLTYLKIDENQITEIPATISNLSALKYLNLSRNQITVLPPELLKLTQLTDLILEHNQIACLPEEIDQFPELTSLLLSFNKITSLPKTICKLTNLIFLYLNNNQLTEVPQDIGKLINLYRLHLENNKLKTIPASIINLHDLDELNLADNPLESLPLEMGTILEEDGWKKTSLNLHGFPAKGQWETLSDEQKQLLSQLKTHHEERTGKYYLSYLNHSNTPELTTAQKQTI